MPLRWRLTISAAAAVVLTLLVSVSSVFSALPTVATVGTGPYATWAPTLSGGGRHGVVVDEMVTAARRALDESRGVIAALIRPIDEPLATALTRVAEETAGRWGAKMQADVTDGLEVQTPAREALLRIVGEAVANAARHGEAQRTSLTFETDPDLRLSNEDDEVGFDTASLAQPRGRRGIAGMRERAAALRGALRIDSQPGAGTQVVVVLP